MSVVNDCESAWEAAKHDGSTHYKTGGIEPIDLYRAIKPHPDLSALDVKALTDCIKYAARMLKKGLNDSDINKIRHYLVLVQAAKE